MNKNIRYTDGLPPNFYKKVTNRLPRAYLKNSVTPLFENINKWFDSENNYVTTTTNIFLSRCISVSEIIKKRLRTCGSLSSLAVACLRKLGYQARLVDGKVYSRNRWRSHAWIEVWLPQVNRWTSYDLTSPDYQMRPKCKKLGIYYDWSELEPELLRRKRKNRS